MPSIQTLGVPVHSVNWVRIFPAIDANNKDCLVAVMGQQADNFTVVKIDPGTGATVQVTATIPESNYPTAAMLSRSGMIYIGAAHSGHLFRYDPETEILDDLGAINPPDDIFPCRIDEDINGVLWIGCYGTAGLTSYDPATGVFIRHGRMDETDMYCYPLAAPDGTIACEIKVTRPHVVVFDPETGIHKPVGPVVSKEKGGSATLIRATDGTLYIKSSEGHYHLDGFDAIPVDVLPDPERPPAMSDGTMVEFADRDTQMFKVVEMTYPKTGETKQLPIEYESAGSELFLVHRGPDDHIYGSSILPLHLFRYALDTGDIADLGVCSTSGGEAYSMGNLDCKLYICAYPSAKLSVYDPARPYHFGTEPGSNPRELGRMDEVSYRPRSMVTGPLDRVWTASVPDYGLWGGPLSWYDPATEQFGTYRDIADEASCWSLAWLEQRQLLAVGTTINGGTGTQPRVEQAVLFLWDYEQKEKIWEGTLDTPIHTINALTVDYQGLLYGTAIHPDQSILFVFDPDKRSFIHSAALPQGRPLDGGLQTGPAGMIYGFTTSCFYRLDPSDFSITQLFEKPDAFQTAGPMMEDDVYFAQKHEIKKLVIE
jgi:hypothetical protein